MADHTINPDDYSELLRELRTTDPAHADIFNPLFNRLINNDAFIKALLERKVQEHTHSGADGDGEKIPFSNIEIPTGEGGIVTDKDLAHHINERNPHGTRPSDMGAASAQEFTTHLADYVEFKEESTTFKTIKFGKDAEGIFTTIERRRKAANTLISKSVLSGGTSPLYTNRTVTYYESNGTTVKNTYTYALTYDADGVLVSEV
ncbi:hypothetical protein MKZ26_03160 [Sporosarcina sp. FSL K6-6792]|uniref:hypothetical protein n=1 Tax=Sporosarcina sp. FSL K6-6792 TaxID=2921559 RepID=UPI0030FB0D5F